LYKACVKEYYTERKRLIVETCEKEMEVLKYLALVSIKVLQYGRGITAEAELERFQGAPG